MRRFLDLYTTEAREHLRDLQQSLLALEGADAAEAVAAAFRAAHTIKGLSAAMGYTDVAERAHRLEDRLDELRGGRSRVTRALVDDLLAQADGLEEATALAVATIVPQLDGGGQVASYASTSDAVHAQLELPPGTRSVAWVRLRADAPVKTARALLILRGLDGLAGVLGSVPAEFDDSFAGELYLFLTEAADVTAVEQAIFGAGEVEAVDFIASAEWHTPAAAPVPAPVPPLLAPAHPQRHVRVDQRRLDRLADGIGELSVIRARLAAVPGTASTTEMVGRMNVVLDELQHAVLAMRMISIAESFARLPRVLRDAARTSGKEVELRLEGEEVELDRSILDEIGDPLVHLLRNAVDHGVETPAARREAGKPARGLVVIRAERERSSVRITVQDDGRGVTAERLVGKGQAAGLLPADARAEDLSADDLFRIMSHAGVSTAEEVGALSGRGVGLDAVVSRIRALGGAIEMRSSPGEGTTFAIRLPVTLALAQALRVRVGGEDFAIPLTHVAEAVELNGNVERNSAGQERVRLREELLPLVRLGVMLHPAGGTGETAAVIAERGDRRVALAVHELVGREQILVKSFDAALGTLPYFSGATLLADGRPALVLDPLSVI